MMTLVSDLARRLDAARRRPVADNVLALLSGSAAGQFGLAVATLITARVLGDERFGQYAAGFALASLTSFFFIFGMDGWLLQQARLPREALYRATSNSLLVRCALGAIWLPLLVLVAPLISRSTYPRDLIWMIAATVWADGMLAACLSTFKATLRNRITALVLAAVAGTLLAGTLLLATFQVQSVHLFAALRLIISLIALAGTVSWFHARYGLQPAPRMIRPMLQAAVPFVISDILYLTYQKVDIIIISARLDQQAVGLYSPASSLIGMLFLVPSAIFMVAVPVLSRSIDALPAAPATERTRRYRTLRHRIGKLFAATLGLGLLLSGGLWLVADPLIALLLPTYAATGRILRILSPLLLFKAGSFAAAAVLVAADRQRQRVYVQAAAALFNGITNWLIVQQFGIAGVAWIFVASEALLFAGYLLLVYRWWRGVDRTVAAERIGYVD